jgi:hypothetical protein
MIGWYSSHTHSEKVMKHVQQGFQIPVVHTDRFQKRNAEKQEAILYGILRGCADVIHHNFKNGLDYLHIDNGYIKRHHFSGYYRISLNDTQAKYKDVNLPNERAKKLDVKIRDWVNNEHGLVLIIPHTPAFEIFYGVDIQKWLDTTIKKLNGRPYKVRTKFDSTPLEDDLKSAKCVITFNSNAALEAILFGIPAIATSNHSIIKSWNNLTMENVEDCFEKCSKLDRNKLLNFISYHQFTLDEIDKGIAPAIIREMRKENVY